MSSFQSTFTTLPTELQFHIVSLLDYATLITTLAVNEHFNTLASSQPLLQDPEHRVKFLISQESSISNTRSPGSAARPAAHWRWPSYACKSKFVCFSCLKLKPFEKFAQGQFFRMMLPDDYTLTRKRFCIDCGIKEKKYTPGSMIMSVELGFMVHLCGACKRWSRDFFCMEDKLCFGCTERVLVDKERFVLGFEEGVDGSDSRMVKGCEAFDDNSGIVGKEGVNWPRRPPCCRRCGSRWRFTPSAFKEHSGEWNTWRRGYKIVGTPRDSSRFIWDERDEQDYMSWFCPYPISNYYK